MIERTGNKNPQHCEFRNEATSFQKHIQTNALERTGRNSKEEYIRITHFPEAKERW